MSAPRRAWVLCLFTCLFIATYAALYLTSDFDLFSVAGVEEGLPALPLAVVLGAVVGALILSRYPHNLIGWLLSIGQAGSGLGLAAGAYAYRVLVEHELGPATTGHVAAWVSHLFGAAYALPLMCALFMLVPDGRLPSWRWRPVMAVVVASYALYAGVMLIAVPPLAATVKLDQTPTGPVAQAFLDLSGFLLFIALLAAAAALAVRLRRSTGQQRQQLRWIMASAMLLAVGAVLLAALQATVGPAQPWYAILPLYLGYASVPVCTGIAILRYRLYDIDVIISRAFMLAVLATFVTVGYVAVVVAIGAVLGTRVYGQFWPSLAALVLVALAFQPLRQRVLKVADRLVYGQRAAPYEALADFSRRLGRGPAPSELLPPLAEAVARGVGAAYARVSLDVPGAGGGVSVAWPDEADRVPDFEIEVRDRHESLGRIALTMPPGRGLLAAERRLLEDFAAQAGLAFRNLRLEAELRARVEQVGRQSAELAASRRRLLAAQDEERQRIAQIIQREVLTHLRPIPPALESLDVTDDAVAGEILARLEAATDASLDVLREVTRGLFPLVLMRQGLAAALRSHFARTGLSEVLRIAPPMEGRRFEQRAETAAYFCSLAVMRDVVMPARLALTIEDGNLVLEMTGGSPRPVRPVDERRAIVDRVEAVGGRVSEAGDPDGRFALRVEIPAGQAREANAQTAASRSVPKADLAT